MAHSHKKRSKSDKLNYGRRLDKHDREQMFLIYQQRRSIRDVAIKLGLHRKTVRKWSELDHWDDRCDGIERKTQTRVDEKIVNRRLRNVKILDTAISSIKKQLEDGDDVDPKHLSKLVATQELLLGRGAADDEVSEVSEDVKAAVEILKALPAEQIKMIADLLSEKVIALPEPIRTVQ